MQVGLEFLQKTMVSYKSGSNDFYIVYQVPAIATVTAELLTWSGVLASTSMSWLDTCVPLQRCLLSPSAVMQLRPRCTLATQSVAFVNEIWSQVARCFPFAQGFCSTLTSLSIGTSLTRARRRSTGWQHLDRVPVLGLP